MLARRVFDVGFCGGVVGRHAREPPAEYAQPLVERREGQVAQQRKRLGDVVEGWIPLPSAQVRQRPAIGEKLRLEHRPIGADGRAQRSRDRSAQLREPAVELRERLGARGRVGHDEPVGVPVVADADGPIGLELPVAIEELLAECAAECVSVIALESVRVGLTGSIGEHEMARCADAPSGCCTISTGQGAWRTTFSATLPASKCSTKPRSVLAHDDELDFELAAQATIASAGPAMPLARSRYSARVSCASSGASSGRGPAARRWRQIGRARLPGRLGRVRR